MSYDFLNVFLESLKIPNFLEKDFWLKKTHPNKHLHFYRILEIRSNP